MRWASHEERPEICPECGWSVVRTASSTVIGNRILHDDCAQTLKERQDREWAEKMGLAKQSSPAPKKKPKKP
jgi:hypothetical protein